MNFIESNVQEIYNGIKNIPRIHELNNLSILEFIVSSQEDVLDVLIDQNDILVVGGAFFGDEGKGKTVAAIANHPSIKLIARTNSGENAGHTVGEYIFHLVPSGILTGKQNVIGPNCVMDPISFMNKEIQKLIDNNIDYSNLIVGNVHIVTPYHKIIDALGTANSSTLKGMSPVHSSKVRKSGLRLDDLFNSVDNQASIIKKDIEIYNALLKQKNKSELEILDMCEGMNNRLSGRIPEHLVDFLKSKDKTEFLIELYKTNVKENDLFPRRGDVTKIIQDTLENKGKVLLEGPQSYFLSNNVETYWGSSTSADTSSAGIKASAGFNQEKYKSVTINVHKTPTSRVGIGGNPSGYVKQDFFSKRNIEGLKDFEMACDDFDTIQKQFSDSIQENGIVNPTIYKDNFGEYTIGAAMAIASSKKHKEFGATTKKPRVCGIFDCVAHHALNNAQGPYLTISALDRLNFYDNVGLVVAYAVFNPNNNESMNSNGVYYKNGDIIKVGESIPNENVLRHCYPIIKKLPGWKNTPIKTGMLKKGDELPMEVNNFLSNIEMYTGAEIISFGDGPETENLVYVKRK
jgi:adenylosuccinate synthase